MAALDEADRGYIGCFHGGMEAIRHIVRRPTKVVVDSWRAITAFVTPSSIGDCERSLRDVNYVDRFGKTVLHRCVSAGHLRCVKLLVRRGARLDVKCNRGLTPLLKASAGGRSAIVKYLIKLPLCPVADKIDALELLGATYAVDYGDHRMDRAAHYWSKSLKERGEAKPDNDVSPKSKETHPVFGVVEFSTDEDLNQMRLSVNEMRMQSLVVRERIFGAQHSLTSKYIIDVAYTYAEEGDVDTSTALLTHVLDLQYNGCNWTLKEFKSLINMLSEAMIEDSPAVKYKDLIAVLMKMVNVVEHEMKPQLEPKRPWNCTAGNGDLFTVLRSLDCIMATFESRESEQDLLDLWRVIEKLVQLNVCSPKGYTPLHVAGLMCKSFMYSPLSLIQLLLEAGADPGAVGHRGNTPLHIVATKKHRHQHQMIQLLLNSGAHYDACNDKGQRFTDLLDSENKFTVDNPLDYISLQCLSAKVVKRCGIEFESKVPSRISEFIKMH